MARRRRISLLRAAGLLSVAGVDSFLTARCGDARNSPPWPQPKSLAAAPLVVSKQALSEGKGSATVGVSPTESNGHIVHPSVNARRQDPAWQKWQKWLNVDGSMSVSAVSTMACQTSHSEKFDNPFWLNDLVEPGPSNLFRFPLPASHERGARLCPQDQPQRGRTGRQDRATPAPAPCPRNQISHSEKFHNPLSLNDPVEPGPPRRPVPRTHYSPCGGL